MVGSPQLHEGIDLLEGGLVPDPVGYGRDARRKRSHTSDEITGGCDKIFEELA